MSLQKKRKELLFLQDKINEDVLDIESEFKNKKDNLNKKLEEIEKLKKDIIENNIVPIQKKLEILKEKEDLEFNQNKLEKIIVDSIKLDKKVKPHSLHSGSFLGFIYGFGIAFITVLSIMYSFSLQSHIKIDEKFLSLPLNENVYLSKMFFDLDPIFILASLSLLFLFILFFTIALTQNIFMKRNQYKVNLFKDKVGEYKLSVGDKINNLVQINNHLDKYLKALNIYRVLLLEESGKLDRILFFIDEDIENSEKPLIAISNIQEMLFNLNYLISTDILTDEGVLSVEAIGAVNNSIDYLNVYISYLYKDEFVNKDVS